VRVRGGGASAIAGVGGRQVSGHALDGHPARGAGTVPAGPTGTGSICQQPHGSSPSNE
jgi:hypothetical protein